MQSADDMRPSDPPESALEIDPGSASTPFDAQGELVKGGLREQIDFIVGQGARGIVAGGSTGEGHTPSRAASRASRWPT